MNEKPPLNEEILNASQYNTQPAPTDKEIIAMAYALIDRLTDTIFELDDGYYSGADEVLYADRWCCLVENSISPEFLDSDLKNLRLFTKHI